MKQRTETAVRPNLWRRLAGVAAGAAVVASVALAPGCLNVKVDKGAVQVPGYTWPPEEEHKNDRQLPDRT